MVGATITAGGAEGLMQDEHGYFTIPVKLTGKWIVEEWQPCDRAAFFTEAGYRLVQRGREAFMPLVEYQDPHPEAWPEVRVDKRIKIITEA